ncbi:MAG: aspartate kinase [Elusimicrobia bacterium]|nr:aspartate kinase [Elusimicrobiota bacterium]
MIVMKFGGSSVAGAEKISRVAAIVKGRLKEKPVLVVSAFRGVTDDLLALGPEALKDDLSRITAIKKRHQDAAKELGVDFAPLEPLFVELRELARGVELLRELTPRTIDRLASFGERLSARLIAAAFVKAGIPALAVDAFDAGLLVDGRFGGANPLPEADAAIAKAFASFKELPVVTGFIGRTPSGEIATLGRNGSDYTATILGAALGAKEIQIWSDTDGIMTADPRIVPSAQPLSTLSFDEACELAYYGGKVLHPHTLVPAMRKDIPVRVLNTFKPEHPGTSIIAKPPKGQGGTILKSIAFKRRQSIVSASSPKMLSGHGFLARIFATLARHELDVDMVSTSEVSVSATTSGGPGLQAALTELNQEFETSMETGKAVVCAVGDGIQAARGVAADVFAAVSGAGVNVRMISQGASKNNIAFVVDDAEVEKTVGALHARFFK